MTTRSARSISRGRWGAAPDGRLKRDGWLIRAARRCFPRG
jgi:hypothetical protein